MSHAKIVMWLAAIFFAMASVYTVNSATINEGGSTANNYCSSFATGIAMQSYLEPFSATSTQITGTYPGLSNVYLRFSLKFSVDQATTSQFVVSIVPTNYYAGGEIVSYQLSPQDITDLNTTNDYIIFEKQMNVGSGIAGSGYARYFYPPTSNNGGFGPATYSIGFYSNQNVEKCTYATSTNSGIYYALGMDGLTPLPNTSQFSNIQPAQSSTTASNNITLSTDFYRANDGYGVYFNQVCVEVDQLDFYGSYLPFEHCFPAAFSGEGSFATSTIFADGIYNAVWYLWDEADGIKALATSTQFTVVQNTVGSYEEILNQFGGASTTPVSLSSCVAQSGDATSLFDISGFIYAYTKCLFLPQPGVVGSLTTSFKDDVLKKFPWGYGTRLYDLMYNATSSATTSLPSIAVTVPSTLPMGGASFDFSPWGPIQSAVTRLEAATTTTMEDNAMETFLYYWNLLWYLAFGLWLMWEIYGVWKPDFIYQKENNNKNI